MPNTASAGSTFVLGLTPSLNSSGGPADSGPAFSVDLPTGETFSGNVTAPNWSCAVSGRASVLSCTWAGPLPQAAGSGLGVIDATVRLAAGLSGAVTTAVTVTDPADGVTTVSGSGTVTVSQKAPGDWSPAGGRFGYRLVGSDGGVFDFGGTRFQGSCEVASERCQVLVARAVAMASTPDGHGYWVAAADGGVFGFGDARFEGSCPTGDHPCGVLRAPIVALAAAPDANGYWLAGANGAVFGFGDAKLHGSLLGQHVDNVVGIAATPDGGGYWLVTRTGTVYSFGDAAKLGSCTGPKRPCRGLVGPIVGIASTPGGQGYWLAAADGGVFAFGHAHFMGNTYTANVEDQLMGPVVGIAPLPDGRGYWLAAADGGVFAFGQASFLGNTRTAGIEPRLVGRVVGIAYSVAG